MIKSKDSKGYLRLFNEHAFVTIQLENQDAPFRITAYDVNGTKWIIARFDTLEKAEREMKRLSNLHYPHEINFD